MKNDIEKKEENFQKQYQTPVLIEYGSIAELTKSGVLGGGDGLGPESF